MSKVIFSAFIAAGAGASMWLLFARREGVARFVPSVPRFIRVGFAVFLGVFLFLMLDAVWGIVPKQPR